MGDTGISSILKTAAPYVAAAATVTSAALPLFLKDDDIKAPTYTPTTADEVQATAAKEATERRRELARRRGQASTIRTPLGARPDFGVRTTDITGV